MKLSNLISNPYRIHKYVGIILFALFYIVLATIGSDKLYWESTQTMFRYSFEYFNENWILLAGSFFTSQFLLQFFIFPYLGALIIVGLYVAIYFIIRNLLVEAKCSFLFAHYVALSMLVVLQWWVFSPTFSFLILIPLIAFYGTIVLFLSLQNQRNRQFYFMLFSLWILPFFVGAWTFVVGLFMILYIIQTTSSPKNKTLSKHKRFILPASLIFLVLLSLFFPPYIWQHTFFTQNYLDLLLSTPLLSFEQKYSVLWIFIATPVVIILIAQFVRIGSLLKNYIGVGIFITTVGVAVFLAFTSKTITLLNLFYKVERNIEHREWETALMNCNKYLTLTEHDEDKGLYYSWIVDDTKFALCMTGRLLEEFFSYNKYLGFGVLLPQSLENSDKSHTGVYNFLSAVGLPSEGMHSAFERTIGDNGSPLVLNNLIQMCFTLGDYRPSVEFINRLDESLLYKKQAQHYREMLMDTATISADSFYIRNRQLLPGHDFQTGWEVDANIIRLYRSNSNNQRALEYCFAVGLSYKEHFIILQDIDSLQKFNYTHIPRHIEEALLIHLNYGQDPEMTREKISNMTFAGMKIRPKTIDRCDEFFKELDKYNMGLFPSKRIAERFGDTYWYHFLFVKHKEIKLKGQNSYEIS